jgi:hypothetical protein
MVPNMKDSKTTVMFAVLVASLVLALVSVSYTESVSAHHDRNPNAGEHLNGCNIATNPGKSLCEEDGLGLDEDPDEAFGTCCDD